MLFFLILLELFIVFAGILILDPLKDSFDSLRSELFLFSRTLSEILKMDIPLSVALDRINTTVLELPTDFHKELGRITMEVQSGSTLTDAVKKHNKYFPRYYIQILELGEKNDTLPGALDQLAHYTTLRAGIGKGIASGLYYPFTILIIMVLIFLSIVEFIIPGFISLFGKFDSSLPAVTNFIININRTIDDNIIILILFPVILLMIYLAFKDRMKSVLDKIRLHLPYFSDTERLYEYAVFARSLQLVISRGDTLDSALNFAGSTLSNDVYRKKLDKVIRTNVSDLSSFLEKTGLFSPAFIWMVSLGEKTDSLSESLKEIGEYYTEELILKVEKLSRFLEVFITFLVGLLSGVLIVALFAPLGVIVNEIAKQIIVN